MPGKYSLDHEKLDNVYCFSSSNKITFTRIIWQREVLVSSTSELFNIRFRIGLYYIAFCFTEFREPFVLVHRVSSD